MTHVDFVRFNATDGVELQGWLTNSKGNHAAIHIHGMSGNGYENYFLDNLRQMYLKNGVSFFSFDNRGRGIISDFRQKNNWKRAGSCFEKFEECPNDIQGALDYLKTLGKTRFILEGHSLGCTKIVSFLINYRSKDVEKVILIAPTDMVGWAKSHTNSLELMNRAHKLLNESEPESLVDAQCWWDKTPISAATYVSICAPGSNADIYGNSIGDSKLNKLSLPTLIVYGDNDIGIKQIDGDIEHWLERVCSIKHQDTTVNIINGATHGFKEFESQLTNKIEKFITPNT